MCVIHLRISTFSLIKSQMRCSGKSVFCCQPNKVVINIFECALVDIATRICIVYIVTGSCPSGYYRPFGH